MKFSTSLTSIATLAAFLSSASAAALPVDSTSLATRSSDLAPRYATGWCGIHVVLSIPSWIQFNDYDVQYAVEVTLKGSDGAQIGYLPKTNVDKPVSVNSELPNVMVINSMWDQDGYINFSYGADSWASNDESRCKVGNNGFPLGYTTAEMDCGFTCS